MTGRLLSFVRVGKVFSSPMVTVLLEVPHDRPAGNVAGLPAINLKLSTRQFELFVLVNVNLMADADGVMVQL